MRKVSIRAARPGRSGIMALTASLPLLATAAGAAETTATAAGQAAAAGHHDPVAPFLLLLAVIVMGAALGRWISLRLNQPPVLGELFMGVLAGNIGYHLLGHPFFVLIMNLSTATEIYQKLWASGQAVAGVAGQVLGTAAGEPGGAELIRVLTGPDGAMLFTIEFALSLFSSLGVVLLLFMVGLETSVPEMLRVGKRAAAVGAVGTVVPAVLGLLASFALFPQAPFVRHLFIGATLCATSVGITARVYRDMGRLQDRESQIVLGAAVIDDILGLLVLAVVTGIVTTGAIQAGVVVQITLLSVLFLGAVIGFGGVIVRAGIRLFSWLDQANLKLLFPVSLMFIFSWIAAEIGLAVIIGAFAAGLILTETQFRGDREDETTLAQILHPLESLFAPVFFVLMGMQVDLATFVNPAVLSLAAVLTAAAIVGKLVSGAVAGRGLNRLAVGIGMTPRGEVGLIFASIGKGLGVIQGPLFSALVVVIILTTVVTPPALKWALAKRPAEAA